MSISVRDIDKGLLLLEWGSMNALNDTTNIAHTPLSFPKWKRVSDALRRSPYRQFCCHGISCIVGVTISYTMPLPRPSPPKKIFVDSYDGIEDNYRLFSQLNVNEYLSKDNITIDAVLMATSYALAFEEPLSRDS